MHAPAHARADACADARADVRRRWRGQSLLEFAIFAPILIGLMGATTDFARAYEQLVKLESATRDAAEYVVSSKTVTSSTLATTTARQVVCSQFGLSATCTSPQVTVDSYTSSTTAPGAHVEYPLVSATITSSLSFQTLFPYPFLTDRGATTLTASTQYAVLRGR
jgi:Flp pilus assembly protein TadG